MLLQSTKIATLSQSRYLSYYKSTEKYKTLHDRLIKEVLNQGVINQEVLNDLNSSVVDCERFFQRLC